MSQQSLAFRVFLARVHGGGVRSGLVERGAFFARALLKMVQGVSGRGYDGRRALEERDEDAISLVTSFKMAS